MSHGTFWRHDIEDLAGDSRVATPFASAGKREGPRPIPPAAGGGAYARAARRVLENLLVYLNNRFQACMQFFAALAEPVSESSA